MENLYLGIIFVSFLGLSILYFSEIGKRKRLEDVNKFFNGARKDWAEKYFDLKSQYEALERDKNALSDVLGKTCEELVTMEKQNTDLRKSRNKYKARLIRREKLVKTLLTKIEKNG